MELTNTTQTGRFVVPELLVTHFHVREGDKVADFGAGSGFFVPVLSKAVGPEGRVYALEIQRSLSERIGELVRQEELQNVDTLWCDIERVGGTKLEDEILDIAIVVNTLFLFEDKDTAVKEIYRTLRSGGKLFVVDWSESFGGLGPQPQDVVDVKEAVTLFESNGFVMERDFDAGDHHYGVAFRKP